MSLQACQTSNQDWDFFPLQQETAASGESHWWVWHLPMMSSKQGELLEKQELVLIMRGGIKAWIIKAVDSENLSFLKVGATQRRQTRASKTTPGTVSYWRERLQGWFYIYTSHRIFQWQLCSRETVSFPNACQEKHDPSHLATIFDHPPPFLTNGLTHSLCCWPKGILLRKH